MGSSPAPRSDPGPAQQPIHPLRVFRVERRDKSVTFVYAHSVSTNHRCLEFWVVEREGGIVKQLYLREAFSDWDCFEEVLMPPTSGATQ